jgi:hypothetical protein
MTDNAARLARIAAVAPPDVEPRVKIIKLQSTNGIDVFMWLCDLCKGERLAKGWVHLETRRPQFGVECQDCRWRREHP